MRAVEAERQEAEKLAEQEERERKALEEHNRKIEEERLSKEESEEQNRMATGEHQSNLGKLNEVNRIVIFYPNFKSFHQKFRFNNRRWMIWRNDFKRSWKRIKKLLTQTQQHLLKRQNSQTKILIRTIVRLNRLILIYLEKSKKRRNFEQIFIF